MKKKSGNPRERTRQIALLVRGPLNAKEKGELGELAFLHKAASLGFGVAQPYGDKEPYDFILDSGERFWRMQAKSTSCAEADHSGYIVAACHSGPKYKVKPYRADEIDFFAAYIVPLGIWYVVPLDQLSSLRFPRLHPSGCRSGGGCFEAFREAWHLDGAGSRLAPTPDTAPGPHKPPQQAFHQICGLACAVVSKCKSGLLASKDGKGTTPQLAEKRRNRRRGP